MGVGVGGGGEEFQPLGGGGGGGGGVPAVGGGGVGGRVPAAGWGVGGVGGRRDRRRGKIADGGRSPTGEDRRGEGKRERRTVDGDGETPTCSKWVGFPRLFFPSWLRLLRFPQICKSFSFFGDL